jgi:hypothetical protein
MVSLVRAGAAPDQRRGWTRCGPRQLGEGKPGAVLAEEHHEARRKGVVLRLTECAVHACVDWASWSRAAHIGVEEDLLQKKGKGRKLVQIGLVLN